MQRLIVLFLLLSAGIVFPDTPKKYFGIFANHTYIEISSDRFYFNDMTGFGVSSYWYPTEIRIVPAAIKKISKVPFVLDSSGNKRALLLYNDEFILMYYKDTGWNTNWTFLEGAVKESDISDAFSPEDTITASSYLVEGKTQYAPKNVGNTSLSEPWVEGAKGQGIGEYIEFTLQSDYGELKASGLYLVNGFVSWDKPELYEYNSRVKRLKVTDITANESWSIELEDSPCPQYIDFTSRESHRIRFTIEDVYPGTRYEDTCIGGIVLIRK